MPRQNDIIIGVVGPKRSGKTEVSNMLVRRNVTPIESSPFTSLAFAAPIKRICKDFGFRHAQLYGGDEHKEAVDPRFGITPRQFMQWTGDLFRINLPEILMHAGNDTSPLHDAWNCAMRHSMASKEGFGIVIEDVRFKAECDFVMSYPHGHLVFVYRPELESTDTHNSEALTWDVWRRDIASKYGTDRCSAIMNTGTLGEFHAATHRWYMDLTQRVREYEST